MPVPRRPPFWWQVRAGAQPPDVPARLDPGLVAPTMPRIERPVEPMRLTQHLIIAGCLVGLLGSPTGRSAELEYGPLLHDFKLTLAPGRRLEAAGPLVSYERGDTQTQWALSPLISHAFDPGTEFEEFDLAYPLL